MNEETKTEEIVKDEGTGKVETQVNENKDGEKVEKTYTQAEYNALDKKLKEKYEKKYEGIDIAKYNEWVESQKTAEEKNAEREANFQKVQSELVEKEHEISILKAGVKPDDTDYVLFKVSKMEGDFNENLARFLEENEKFTKQEPTEPKSTGAPVTRISSETTDGVAAILKAKHPEMNF